MADEGAVAKAAEGGAKATGNFLTRKLGPLPVWAWGLLAGGAAAAFLYWKNAQDNSISGGLQNALGALGVGSPSAGFDSGGGGSGGSSTGTPSTLTNSQWLTNVLTSAAASAGIPLNEAQLFLNEYLAGTPPNLSGAAETAYQSVVAAAIALGGAPPTAPPSSSVNANPFTSNASWFNEILSFLPTGTTFEGESLSQIQQALTSWFNGASTTLTQAEADALAAAQGVVGNAPNPLTYTIGSTPPGTKQAAPLTSIDVNTLTGIWQSLGQYWTSSNPLGTWLTGLQTALPGASTSQLTQLWNFINANLPFFVASGPGSIQAGQEWQNITDAFNAILAGKTPTTSGLTYQPQGTTSTTTTKTTVAPGPTGGLHP